MSGFLEEKTDKISKKPEKEENTLIFLLFFNYYQGLILRELQHDTLFCILKFKYIKSFA